jgi:hypothetical protein
VRAKSAKLVEDRPLAAEIAAVSELVAGSEISRLLS